MITIPEAAITVTLLDSRWLFLAQALPSWLGCYFHNYTKGCFGIGKKAQSIGLDTCH